MATWVVGARRRLRRYRGLAFAVALVLASCKSPAPELPERGMVPALHVEDVLAPPLGSTTRAIQELERLDRPGRTVSRERLLAVRLRLAALHLRLGDLAAAERQVDRVLFGSPPAGSKAEAIAWYLRALAKSQLGLDPEARQAFARAEQLAVEPGLRRRLRDAGWPPAVGVARRPPVVGRPAPKAVTLVRRAQWGSASALPARMTPMQQPNRITVHHSGMYCAHRLAVARQQVQSFQRNHIKQRGWGDIGYHFLIAPGGQVLEGRDLRYQGAHAGNSIANARNIGICLLGNFHPSASEPAQKPTAEQVRSLGMLVRSLSRLHDIPPERVYTHQEVHPRGRGATECPGRYLTPLVVGLRSRLRLEGALGAK